MRVAMENANIKMKNNEHLEFFSTTLHFYLCRLILPRLLFCVTLVINHLLN